MSAFKEYDQHDALSLAELVTKKEVQPSELVEAAIQRIERFNPALNAVICELYDQARQAAAGPLPEGPFKGVPYLIKDMVAHAGTPTTYGSSFLKKLGHVHHDSHEVIARTEQAGFIFIGKTNAPEFGLLPITEPEAHGPTANPWDLDRSPGGSSGGSACAVAAGMVPMAHGNDGGGSIRIPASACGVFGLKPSRGRNPSYPTDTPDGIVTEHCLSRTVRDSAALLDVTRGPLPGDRWWAPLPDRSYLKEAQEDPGPLRIAFSAESFTGQRPHADCVTAVEDAARLCESLGHHVEEARPDIDGKRFNEIFIDIWASMTASIFVAIMEQAKKKRPIAWARRLFSDRQVLATATRLLVGDLKFPFERWTWQIADIGKDISHASMVAAAAELHKMTAEMNRFLGRYHCLLTPVLAEPPLETGALAGMPIMELKDRVLTYGAYTPICNATGLPAMSVPLHWNGAGLPIGVQFMGRFADESTLFALAGQLERESPWSARRPPL